MYNYYIAQNMDCVKLKYILNVFNNRVLRRTCAPEREEVTVYWRKQINDDLQKRSAGGLHEKKRRMRNVPRFVSERNRFKFNAENLKMWRLCLGIAR
jgi:hypothetical protein